MSRIENHKVKPAGRHLLTIGRDLIQDQYAAIVELVKNSYDADSPDVQITFRVPKDRSSLTIVVEDHGHGMSTDTVINSWLVPSTNDKLRRKKTPKGRIMQGRKGVGRYSASMLGEFLFLETVFNGEKTEVVLEWDKFENAQYLDDVDLQVEISTADEKPGTKLTIKGDREQLLLWNKKEIDKLTFALKKLISPISSKISGIIKEEPFEISLNFDGFWEDDEYNISEKIESYPIFKLCDYQISGLIDNDGKGELTYVNQKARNTIVEKIPFQTSSTNSCGHLYFDFRIYDRDKDSIDMLINRGLRDERGNYVGKLQAKTILNKYNGIGVYRHGFRIRPMGDPGFDWLELDKRRVQNPSMKIGSNQVIGYIFIQSEELSGLEEKSARDGLRENKEYFMLKEISIEILDELQKRRFAYRSKEGLGRKTLKVEKELEKLFGFDDLKQNVSSKLNKKGVDKNTTEEIMEIITNKEEVNNQIAKNIQQAVAIYQGQATLGKIINVVLHEGRKPLHYFKNQIPNIEYWAENLRDKPDQKSLDMVIKGLDGIKHHSDVFVSIFKRLDPLAAAKRGPKKTFCLYDVLDNASKVFDKEFQDHDISLSINCPNNAKFTGWKQDISIVFTNLIDNSIYWLIEKNILEKNIEITVSLVENELEFIDFKDTGPGIEPYLLESEAIFEPEFTTKNDGMGLGLAISGEAAFRNDLELKALEYDKGAYFRLQPAMETQDDSN